MIALQNFTTELSKYRRMSRLSRDTVQKGWEFEGFQSQGENINKEPRTVVK